MADQSEFQKKLDGMLGVASDIEIRKMFKDLFSDPEALDMISKYLSFRAAVTLVAGSKGESGEDARINLLLEAVSNFSTFTTGLLTDALILAEVDIDAVETLDTGTSGVLKYD